MKFSYDENLSETHALFSDDLELLVQEVSNRNYQFDAEIREIKEMVFTISEDPEENMISFNSLYARVTSYYSRACYILIAIESEKAVWQKFKSRASRMYRIQENTLLQDEAIQSLRNKELQKATVETRIPDIVRMKILVEDVLDSLSTLSSIVKIKCDELDKAATNLNRQQRVIESMIGLGYQVKVRRN